MHVCLQKRTMGTVPSSLFVLLLSFVLGILLIGKVSSAGLLQDMKAECNSDGIKVHLVFHNPFHGVAYSFGHYENERCRYIRQDSARTGLKNYSFLIPAGECGTIQHGATSPIPSNSNNHSNSRIARDTVGGVGRHNYANESRNISLSDGKDDEIYIENTLLIQHDPSITEAGDLAQKLRCVWQKEIHKPLVASLPFQNVNRRTQPSRAPGMPNHESTTRTRSKVATVKPVHAGGVRFETKGQVESVPYYSYKRKWSRSLRDASTEDSPRSEKKRNEPALLPLALTSTPNRATSPRSYSLGMHALCVLLSSFIYWTGYK